MASASERQPLLGSTNTAASSTSSSEDKKSVWRTITTSTEIVAVCCMFYFGAHQPLITQFIYVKIAENLNYTGPLPNSRANVSRDECLNMNESDQQYIMQAKVQSMASIWTNLNTVVYLVPAFFSCIFLGAYSDRAGRKKAIICPIIGAITKMIIFVIVISLNLHIAFIFVGGFIDGCFGGTAVELMGCFSHLADITTVQQRSIRILILEVCLGVGVVIAQLLTGVVVEYLGYLWPFALLAGMNFLLLLYVIFRIEETVVPNERVPLCDSTYFTKPFLLYIKDPTNSGRRPKLILSLFVILIIVGVVMGSPAVEMLRLMNSPFCWTSVLIGFFLALKYFIAVTGSVSVTKLFQRRFGDLKLVILGCLSGAVYEALFSFVSQDWQVYAVTVAGIFTSLPIGLTRSYMSKLVLPHEMGSLMASIASSELIGNMVGNVTFLQIYRATLTPAYLRGVAFLVMSLVYVIMIFFVGMLLMFPQNPYRQRALSARSVNDGDSIQSKEAVKA